MSQRALIVIFSGTLLLVIAGALLLRSSTPAPEPATAPAPSAGPKEGSSPHLVPTPDAPADKETPRAVKPTKEPVAAPVTPAEPVAAPTTGTLRIATDVPGADVFIDRQYVGPAPATAEKVAPGPHEIKVSAQGFDTVTESVDVTPGPRDLTINLKTIRLDAKLDVTHKHGIGSCKGTLTATAAGMRYTTDNKDDGFAVGLLDLQTFEVDYLAKNLKVKLKSGKTYNFTDPAGNADHLFVFHRDVQKTRDKMK